MAIQTDYNTSQRAGTPGMLRSMADSNVISRVVKSGDTIGFGLAVSQHSVAGQAKLASAPLLGLSVKDSTLNHSTPDRYEAGDTIAIMTEGEMYVTASESVNPGDVVKFNASTGTLGKTSGTTIPRAMWIEGAGSGEVGVVMLGGTY